jgi:hypothetical protein
MSPNSKEHIIVTHPDSGLVIRVVAMPEATQTSPATSSAVGC